MVQGWWERCAVSFCEYRELNPDDDDVMSRALLWWWRHCAVCASFRSDEPSYWFSAASPLTAAAPESTGTDPTGPPAAQRAGGLVKRWKSMRQEQMIKNSLLTALLHDTCWNWGLMITVFTLKLWQDAKCFTQTWLHKHIFLLMKKWSQVHNKRDNSVNSLCCKFLIVINGLTAEFT